MEKHQILVETEDSAEKRKELYHSPKLEIIEITVEKGFADSVGNGGSGTGDWGSGSW